MAGPVYQLWMYRFKEAWYQLSEEEQQSHWAEMLEAIEKVGGKSVIGCVSFWATEQWVAFGVDEYPDVEAIQQKTRLLWELRHYRYVESLTLLGKKFEDEPS
jgi:hypothetical protein